MSTSRLFRRAALAAILATALVAPHARADDSDGAQPDGVRRLLQYIACAGSIAGASATLKVFIAVLGCSSMFLDTSNYPGGPAA